MTDADAPMSSKTMLKRLELYRDRWTSYGLHTGIEALSDKLSAAQLREHEIFREYDDKFLERISPDVSLAAWKADVVLFEQGTYLDLAFFIVDGTVEEDLDAVPGNLTTAVPIFDATRTMMLAAGAPAAEETAMAVGTQIMRALPRGASDHEISFLATLDFELPRGAAARLGPGELVGEIGAMSGWPQSVTARTATPCQLLQIR